MTGQFVAFEGGDACGKTTQARRIAERVGAVLTREPGGTELGEQLRTMVLEPAHTVDLRAEALMIAAARAQHTAELIRPTLASGQHVVTDRFTASSLVYQGHGSGLDVASVAALSEFATDGLTPDLVVLIDVPVRVAFDRLGDHPDRFEREAVDYHERVRAAYLALATADPDGWAVVDGAADLATVSERVDAVFADRLGW